LGLNELILFCNCSWSDVISAGVKEGVLDSLKASGASFIGVDDFCRLAADGDERLAEWVDSSRLTVIACYRRTVEALFSRVGLRLPENARVLNMRQMTADEIIAELGDNSGSLRCHAPVPDVLVDRQGDWMPWFPVIDYARCVDCKQCLNFCLFGVYTLGDDGKVRVDKPANCKTNCPACARVCPHAAIIFPKYADSPINGDEVDEEALANADKSKALADLVDGDVHEIIRNRSKQKKRFAPRADSDELSDEQKAAKLSELQKRLDIPQDVIDSLSAGKAKENKCPNSAFCDKKDCDE
jgi:NAD-dependent dihydropyrimidine dehydrogenase PreA subunit